MFEDVCLKHDTGAGHPECPARLRAIVNRLEASGQRQKLIRIRPAPPEEVIPWIETVHTPVYRRRVQTECATGAPFIDTPDVPVCRSSYESAVTAVGGLLAATDAVMRDAVSNAFCAVRPPGHHALAERAMGFCLFNNVAIAARYLQKKHALRRVLIVDWDVHHGNGTQEAFYEDPSVFYFSVHRYPFYPGTGSVQQQGRGAGKGTTLNVPLAMGSGDQDFIEALRLRLVPAARAFAPEFILISSGFDAHADDPLGGMACTAAGYAAMTRIVCELAETLCGGRLISALEGGYDLQGLAESVQAHVGVLLGE